MDRYQVQPLKINKYYQYIFIKSNSVKIEGQLEIHQEMFSNQFS